MKYFVIIATSLSRTHWLINRSLLSVYKQIGIEKTEWNIFIVDDNKDKTEFENIKKQVEQLREKLHLKSNEFSTTIFKNQRTPFMSGTGAWNTGIFEAYKQKPDGFVSILDDDDEYLPHHLSDCLKEIDSETIAVFQRLIWKNNDKTEMYINLEKEKLTAENFFIGNPGVQGSNMFFKTKNLIGIGGFDETLPNTTDRDLMIRFLLKNDIHKIKIIDKIGVIHHNHKEKKVTSNIPVKQQGLDLFYEKHKTYFSKSAYEKSIIRAKKHFYYTSKEERKEQIVICMPMKNAQKTIEKSISSVLSQINVDREIILLIGNDNSDDKSVEIVQKIASKNSNVILLNLNFENVSFTRNFLNDYARKNYPNCILIGRLDADDVVYDKITISRVEKLYNKYNFDVLMSGNQQIKNGQILEWENKPNKKLLIDNYLLNSLREMADGNPKYELPSCNIFIKPSVDVKYPNKLSAEDHWFTVLLFLQKNKLNIHIHEELLYCIYSLDGVVTSNNVQNNSYIESRKQLYKFFKKQISQNNEE